MRISDWSSDVCSSDLWTISDPDNDPIQDVRLSYREGNGAFTAIPFDAAKNTAAFDVTHFAQARDYELRLEASDGIAHASETVGFSVDNTPPNILSLSLVKKVLGKSDTLKATGVAGDALSGVEYVEYALSDAASSTEQKLDWHTALITSGFLRGEASYAITYPTTLADGVYQLFVRAVDAAGNESAAVSAPVTVDTSPPRIGSFALLKNTVRVSPDAAGVITTYPGQSTFSISLEGDTHSASLTAEGHTVPLSLDIASGLWQGTLNLSSTASTTIFLSAEDNVHNSFTNTSIGSFAFVPHGSVQTKNTDGTTVPLSGASITVVTVSENGESVPFTGLAGSTIETDATGEYDLALPAGTYTLVVTKSGYHKEKETITLAQSAFVSVSFTTAKLSGIGGFIQGIIEYVAHIL